MIARFGLMSGMFGVMFFYAGSANFQTTYVPDDNFEAYLEANDMVEKLKAYMESEKPYLDSQLSLESLAHQTAMTKHDLSQVINDQLPADARFAVGQIGNPLNSGFGSL